MLHVWNVPSRQFQFEHVAVMRASEQHSLTLKGGRFARLEDTSDDVVGLRLVVGDGDVSGAIARPRRGSSHLTILPDAFGNERIGGIEHALS